MNSAAQTLRGFVRGASGPSLLSWRALLWTFLVNTMGTTWSAMGVSSGQWLQWLGASVIGHGVLVVVALGFRATVLPTSSRQSRPGWALIGLATMGLMRGIAVAFVAHWWGIEEFSGSLYRPLGSVILVMISGSLIAWALDENARYRRTISELQTTRKALEESRDSLQLIIRSERQRILDIISTNVLAPVAALRTSLSDSGLDEVSVASAVRRINDLIETSVKPLSRRLHDEVLAWSPRSVVGKPIATRTDLINLKAPMPLAPYAQGITLGSTFPAVLSTKVGLSQAIVISVVMAVLAGTVIRVFKTVLDSVKQDFAFRPLVFMTLVVQVLTSVLVWQIASFLYLDQAGEVLVLGAGVSSMVVGVVVATAILIRRGGQVRESDLRRLNAELAGTVSHISSQVWMHQSRIAEVLHGDVQSSLIVAAARLANSEIFGEMQVAEVENLLKPVEEAVDGLERTDGNQKSIDEVVDEVSTVWLGLLDVVPEISDRARFELSENPELLTLTAALLREAVGNAYRHGGARSVDVRFDVTSEGLLMTVTNEGKMPQGDRVGLGTQLLNAGTISWSRTHSDGWTSLRAILPLPQR